MSGTDYGDCERFPFEIERRSGILNEFTNLLIDTSVERKRKRERENAVAIIEFCVARCALGARGIKAVKSEDRQQRYTAGRYSRVSPPCIYLVVSTGLITLGNQEVYPVRP